MVILRILDLPLDDGVQHEATDWQVSDQPSFATRTLESLGDKKNLSTIIFNEVLDPNIKWYARARARLSTGYTIWGNLDIFLPENDNVIDASEDLPSRIAVPQITTSSDPKDHDVSMFTIHANGFEVLGNGSLSATTWIIEDVFGSVVWSSAYNTTDKTSIDITNIILKANQVYRIKVMFHSTSQDSSPIGCLTIKTSENSDINLNTYLDWVDPGEPIDLVSNKIEGVNSITWSIISVNNNIAKTLWSTVTQAPAEFKVTMPTNILGNDSLYLLKIDPDKEGVGSKFIPFRTKYSGVVEETAPELVVPEDSESEQLVPEEPEGELVVPEEPEPEQEEGGSEPTVEEESIDHPNIPLSEEEKANIGITERGQLDKVAKAFSLERYRTEAESGPPYNTRFKELTSGDYNTITSDLKELSTAMVTKKSELDAINYNLLKYRYKNMEEDIRAEVTAGPRGDTHTSIPPISGPGDYSYEADKLKYTLPKNKFELVFNYGFKSKKNNQFNMGAKALEIALKESAFDLEYGKLRELVKDLPLSAYEPLKTDNEFPNMANKRLDVEPTAEFGGKYGEFAGEGFTNKEAMDIAVVGKIMESYYIGSKLNSNYATFRDSKLRLIGVTYS